MQKIFLTEANSQMGKPAPQTDHILMVIAKERAMYEEANRRGLVASDRVVKDYMNAARGKVKEVKDPNKLASHTETNKGLGITEDEYWDSEATFKAYKVLLTEANLRNEIIKELNIPSEKMTELSTAKYIEDSIQKYADSLTANVEIKKISLD